MPCRLSLCSTTHLADKLLAVCKPRLLRMVDSLELEAAQQLCHGHLEKILNSNELRVSSEMTVYAFIRKHSVLYGKEAAAGLYTVCTCAVQACWE